VLLVTGDRDWAAEATQEAFLRAFEQIDSLRELERFPAWVGSIAVNSATDIMRRRKREIPLGAEALDEAGERETAGGLEDRICHLEQVRGLREAIGRLPLDSRAVIVMYYFQEQDVARIATALGIPQGTVKSRLHHARALLRGIMWKGSEQDSAGK
jgi:RNA polymerase sigma-70 factor (ECF subfamily)